MYRVYFDHFGYNYHFEIVFSFIFEFNRKFKNKIKFFFHPEFINNEREQILRRLEEINEIRDDQLKIKVPNRYDLRIIITVYQKHDLQRILPLKNTKNTLLIAHLYHPDLDQFNNLIYLTPVVNQKNNQTKKFMIPVFFPYPQVQPNFEKPAIFLIQGNIQSKRRNYRSLIQVFENINIKNTKIKNINTQDFRIMIVGRGELPDYLQPYKDKIILKANLGDQEYHNCIQDATFIIPLVDNTFQHDYFKKKLTSSISYGLGFGLRFIIFDKLAKLYKLDNQYVYTNNITNINSEKKEVDLLPAFQQALNDFQNKTLRPRPNIDQLHNFKIKK